MPAARVPGRQMGQKLGKGAAECFGGPGGGPPEPGGGAPGTPSPALGILRTESAVQRFEHHCVAIQQLIDAAQTGQQGQAPLEVTVRRAHLVDDILRIPEFNGGASGLLGRKLKVQFDGEAGIDDTGLTTDFFVSAVQAFLAFTGECDLGVEWVKLERSPAAPLYIGQRVLISNYQNLIAQVGAEILNAAEPAAEAASEPESEGDAALELGAVLSKTTTQEANASLSVVLDIDPDTQTAQLKLASGVISWLPFANIAPDPAEEIWPGDTTAGPTELHNTPSGTPPVGWIQAENAAVYTGMRLRYTGDDALPELSVLAAEQHGPEQGFRVRFDDGKIR